MRCAKCGKEIPNKAGFCKYCGQPIKKQNGKAGISQEKSWFAKRRYALIAVLLAIAALGGIAVYCLQDDGNRLIGHWVPISGFPAPQEFPNDMEISKYGIIALDGSEGYYKLHKDSKKVDLKNESYNQTFEYELVYNDILYLSVKAQGQKEMVAYINLDKAPKEKIEEYHFGKNIYNEGRLKEFLVGKWTWTGTEIGEVDEDEAIYALLPNLTFEKRGGIVYMDSDLPEPETDDSYSMGEGNILTMGSESVKALQFAPRNEKEVVVYCYEDGSYRILKRIE